MRKVKFFVGTNYNDVEKQVKKFCEDADVVNVDFYISGGKERAKVIYELEEVKCKLVVPEYRHSTKEQFNISTLSIDDDTNKILYNLFNQLNLHKKLPSGLVISDLDLSIQTMNILVKAIIEKFKDKNSLKDFINNLELKPSKCKIVTNLKTNLNLPGNISNKIMLYYLGYECEINECVENNVICFCER